MTIPLVVAAIACSALLTIWFGYPLTMWLLARALGQPLHPDREAARRRTVSVVVASRESAGLVVQRVANLLNTAHPAELVEVIVALDATGAAATGDDLEGDTRVRVIRGDAPGGKAATLNAGVRAATGDILVLADVAQEFNRQTIPALVACLEDARFGAVSGALTLGRQAHGPNPVHVYWALEKWLRRNESLLHSSIGVTGAVYAVRRALWPPIPAGTILDDVFVPMMLVLGGHRIGFTYDAQAFDIRAFDSSAEGERKARTLTGVLQLLAILPDVLSQSNPVRAQFVMHKLARLTTPLFVAVLGLAGVTTVLLTTMRNPRIMLPTLLLSGVAVVVVAPLRRNTLRTMRWIVALQAATLRAISNGVRGRWSVWSSPR